MQIITTTDELKVFCKKLAHDPYVTIDTEFIREKTYYPKLCLVQIAGPEDAAVIDPLSKEIELEPLFALLKNQKVLKVFHACRQDIEIFYQLMGEVPRPIFDTQIAAMVCGYGESVGYEPLVAQLTGGAIDKSSRFTDWARRPLSEKQLHYAISDVTHLRPVYEKLMEKIKDGGRLAWIEEEMADLYNENHYKHDPEEAWKKLRLRVKTPKFLAFLKEVAKWRELEAQQMDVPKGRIIKDETLIEIAASAPKTIEELQGVRGFGNHLKQKQVKSLMAALDGARALDPATYPKIPRKKPMPPGGDGVVDVLKLLLKIKCDELGVASRLVATKDDLEDFVMGVKEVPLLHGWRYTLFGQAAEAFAQGKVTVSLDAKTKKIVFNEG